MENETNTNENEVGEINEDAAFTPEATEEATPAKEKSRGSKAGFIERLHAHATDMALVFTVGQKADQQFCDELAEEIEAEGKVASYQKLPVDAKNFAIVLKAWLAMYETEDGCDRHSMEIWRQKEGRYVVFWPTQLVDQAPSDQTAFYRSLSNRLIDALRDDGASVQYSMPSARMDTYEICINGENMVYRAAPEITDLSDFYLQIRELAIDWAASRPDLPPETVKQLRAFEDRDPNKSDRLYFEALLAKRLYA